MLKLSILFVALAMLALACQVAIFNEIGSEEPGPRVLFQDDFSDPDSGWTNLGDSQDGFVGYTAGVYHISITSSQSLLWGGPGLEFTDVRLEVDAFKIAGPDSGDFGLVCRSQDWNNFYYLVVSSDGYYGIGKVVEQQPALIDMPAFLPSESIRTGLSANHLRADCIRNTISLYVNATHVASVEAEDFQSGGVGLLAGTFDTPGNVVVFDNFSVLKP